MEARPTTAPRAVHVERNKKAADSHQPPVRWGSRLRVFRSDPSCDGGGEQHRVTGQTALIGQRGPQVGLTQSGPAMKMMLALSLRKERRKRFCTSQAQLLFGEQIISVQRKIDSVGKRRSTSP